VANKISAPVIAPPPGKIPGPPGPIGQLFNGPLFPDFANPGQSVTTGYDPRPPLPTPGSTTALSEEQRLALDIERINSMFGYSDPTNQYRGATLEDPLTALKSRAGQSGSPFMAIGTADKLGDYGAIKSLIPGTNVYAGFNTRDLLKGDISTEKIAEAFKWATAQAPDYLQAVSNYKDDFYKYGTPEFRAETAAKSKASRDSQLWGESYASTGQKSGGLYGDTLKQFLDEMNRQYSPAYADAATSFATRGMSGSLGDTATKQKLGEAYDRKRLGFTNTADSIVQGISAKDNATRLGILDDLNAGTDYSSAYENANKSLQTNLTDAQHTANTTNLTDIFRDFGGLYDRNLEVNSFNRGYRQGGSNGSGGLSNYQGSIY
jgi:hypothetical protein